MAKGMYVGVGGTARKVKKMYIGVGGVARKVKKAYMGVDGKARCIFSSAELSYYGTVDMPYSGLFRAATTVGNYALFGGGRVGASGTQAVAVFDDSLTLSRKYLGTGRSDFAATTVGNYALFAGGVTSTSTWTKSSSVDAFNSSLTLSYPTSLETARGYLAATTVGNYALFGGGKSNSSVALDVYDSSLTKISRSGFFYENIDSSREYLAATTVGNYALFGGGIASAQSNVVEAFNSSLVKSTPTTLSNSRGFLAATTVGNYALFGGGAYYNTDVASYVTVNVVDAYNSSLTRTTPSALSLGRVYLGATTVDDYALFGGGYTSYPISTTYESTVVDMYDTSLTRRTITSLKYGGSDAATTVGNYALFGSGGYANVYQVS